MAASNVAFQEDEVDDVPEHLICPVCYNLPEAEVYQCIDGHVLCSKCYYKLEECPQCRYKFWRGPPIRNRYFEEMASEFVTIDCCFKSNGCKERVQRLLLQDHKEGCRFNYEKYGNPMSLCKTIKLNCSFQFNNGNTEEAVDHLKYVHGAKITNLEKFQMEITNFVEDIINCSGDSKLWTPVIADLQEKRCYLVCFANGDVKNESLMFTSFFLPYSDYLAQPTDLKMEYSVSSVANDIPDEAFKLQMSVVQKFSSVTESCSVGYGLRISSLDPYITQNGSLLINCKLIHESNLQKDESGVLKCEDIEPSGFARKQHGTSDEVIKRWDPSDGDDAAFEYLQNFTADFESGVGTSNAIEKIKSISDNVKYSSYSLWEMYGPKNMEYITYGALFIVARMGSNEALQEMPLPELNLNTAYELGKPALHWTIQDKDFERGLEKAKILLKNGANLHAVDDQKANVLHWAAFAGNEKAIRFFIDENIPVNGVDAEGKTPLHYALLNRTQGIQWKIGEVLIYFGADKKVQDKQGRIPWDMLDVDGDFKLQDEIGKVLEPAK